MNGNETILEAYKDLRVADIRDGMDSLGMHFVGSMDPSIRPLFRVRAFGIAKTVRYLPYMDRIPRMDPATYWTEWTPRYYREICPYPWVEEIGEGDFIVVDQSGVNAGLMGSENTLHCRIRGARGFVSNGGVRDTDEIILQKMPFWSSFVSQSMVQGRLRFDAMDVCVSVGGVSVNPGDVVAGDGDGIIVVPRAIALEVARYAKEEHERDKKNRKIHYDKLGWAIDETVK